MDFEHYKINLYITRYEYDLDKFMAEASPSNALIKDLINQLYRGMAYLHNNNIIHRDIAPGNILMRHTSLPYENTKTNKTSSNRIQLVSM